MITPENWEPAAGLVLEPNALRAARDVKNSLALTAGPGAGKTEMLAQRADFLLRTGTCYYPQRILAISFKVDASRNLKDRVRKRCGGMLASRLDSYTFHGFAKRIVDRFRPVLSGHNTLDPDYTIGDKRYQTSQITFAELVPFALEILNTNDMALNAIRQTYSHVFLDEFQDCTKQQYQLVSAAFRGTGIHLTAVGDTKQRIMAWAGALDGIFQSFANDFHATPLNLYQNFRSMPRLRRMQNAMVKIMDPAAAMSDTDLAGGGGVISVLAFPDNQKEAETLAAMINARIQSDGVPASEIAILVPKQQELYAERIMVELSKLRVPFRDEKALQDLTAEPASALIVDFLRVIICDCDPDAYERLMATLMAPGLDEDSETELRSRWNRSLETIRQTVQTTDPIQVTAEWMQSVTTQFLEQFGEERLRALSVAYEQGNWLETVVSQTFERLHELRKADPNPEQALARFSEDNAVRIMTIHKSKGLEFDSVVILGVENQTFWGELEPERSVFFVGISRAKRTLWLTHCARRERPSGFKRRWDIERTPQTEFLSYANVG
jgi:superfamily I DNA/RNA helicase